VHRKKTEGKIDQIIVKWSQTIELSV